MVFKEKQTWKTIIWCIVNNYKAIIIEYDCHTFLKCLVFPMKNLVFQIKNPVFWSIALDFDKKATVFQIKKFEIRGISHITFEILVILEEIPDISKAWNFD